MSNSSVKKLSYNVPLWHKPNLSIEEASIYSNIGTGKLYEMTEKQDCPFVTLELGKPPEWIKAKKIFLKEYICNSILFNEKVKFAMSKFASLAQCIFLSML